MLVTFMTPKIGLAGFCFILCFHFLLLKLGYDKFEIKSGLLGFNALLVGLSMTYSYTINFSFIVLFFIALLISLVIIIGCKNYFDRYKLPFLTLPFFIIVNIISLSTKNFETFLINMDFVFYENTLVELQESKWYQLVHSLDSISLPNHFKVFLITLSTIFYQKSVLGGFLILMGMFIFSRIATTFAFLGFYSALFFFILLGGNIENLTYFYSGINFIFFGMAVGCIYYIPNLYTKLVVFLLCPVLMFLMITLNKIMTVFQMNSLSLSFSILTTATLFILNNRKIYKLIIPADAGNYSPEKNLYNYLNSLKVKVANPYYSMSLPFWGEWFVSQGYDGKITHLGDWSQALDFVIVDDYKNTFTNKGQKLTDFYCYNKPIVAPADGYIYNIINHVEENDINDVNVNENWGNSIVFNHLNGLYSQISHVKKDSFVVAVGDYVKKGTLVATCGNSGRSPEPHIHFQLQHQPTVGAKTIALPLSYFIENNDGKLQFKINEIPKENTIVCAVEELSLLLNSFNFKPNNRLNIINLSNNSIETFEIYTNEYNQLYFTCLKSNAKLFFKNDGVLFSFVHYEGTTQSSLFEFYKSCYTLLLGYYPTITIDNYMPNHLFTNFGLKLINDIIAPIYNITTIKYASTILKIDNLINPNEVHIVSKYSTQFLGKSFNKTQFNITVFNDSSIELENQNTKIKYKILCEPY